MKKYIKPIVKVKVIECCYLMAGSDSIPKGSGSKDPGESAAKEDAISWDRFMDD
ncbi:MAG: hypothetical protein K5893_09440 [Prevotella sp.]|nr:hypothetical protein [Prevotella sp.]